MTKATGGLGSKAKRRLTMVATLLVLAGGGYAYYRYRERTAPPPVTYQTAAVEKRKIVGRVTATGTVQARVTVLVGSQVSGRIKKLYADFNSSVKKGQLVAKIDPTLFEANVAQAQANYLAAKADLEKVKAQKALAERQLARLRSLGADQLATASDIDTAETNLAVAASQILAAEASIAQTAAALRQSQTNLSFTNIVSPIDGTVISRSVDVGQTVAASLQAPTIFTIAEDLSKMQVSTNVSEGDVGRLTQGMKARFTVDAYPGKPFFGEIGQIRNAAQTVQNVVTYNAIIDVDNTDLKLRPGMTASVTIIYAERPNVLVVPNAALRFNPPSAANLPTPSPTAGRRGRDGGVGEGKAGEASGEVRTVWVKSGLQVRPVTVRLGLSDGSYTELLDGSLREGEAVAVDAQVSGSAKSSTAIPGGTPGGMRRMF
jgi:HlyD family secretion protein